MAKLRQQLCDARSRLEESQGLHDEVLKEVHEKSRIIGDLQAKVIPSHGDPLTNARTTPPPRLFSHPCLTLP